jgi:hypothetical protein
VNDLVYGDRTYVIKTLPPVYAGFDWIRTATDSKAYTGATLASFKIAANSDVLVAFDDRVTSKPAWLTSGWTDTGNNIVDSEATPVTFSVYSKVFAANTTVSLGPNGQTSGCVLYFVIVKPTGATPNPTSTPTTTPTVTTVPPTPTPTATPTPTITVSTGDVVGHIFTGYQGWFNCYGDGSPVARWRHWSAGIYQSDTGKPAPGALTFELYPDVREYTYLFQTGLAHLGNGQPARLFSSYTYQSVDKHVEWMQNYGLDGAALQRFGSEFNDSVFFNDRNQDALNLKTACEKYGRKFYIMYDISGMGADFDTKLKTDWSNTITGTLNLTTSSAYAKQNGKPVVCIWGIGFTHTQGDATQGLNLINWFKNQGLYVIGGIPTHWLTGDQDSKSGFINTYKAFNMIQPWMVGRLRGLLQCDDFKTRVYQPNLNYCQQNGIDYAPVIYPGFAWSNWNGGEKNAQPRLHGDFMWRQAYNAKSLGISSLYVAMFDEYDEGTAIAKAAEDTSMIPTNQYFLTLDADGVRCSSDFYLRLTGDITKLFKGILPLTMDHPTLHYPASTPTLSPAVTPTPLTFGTLTYPAQFLNLTNGKITILIDTAHEVEAQVPDASDYGQVIINDLTINPS